MRLLRVEAQGFKSFADKVNIVFEDGVTGIVGPNGCGKSNITDAIKWVLGEQSAKSLRGGKMDDIIFAGSQDRPATNMAEVTLVFDNSDRAMAIDYDRVQITRRLFRGEGSNEYFINKQQARLKDIHNLIMDTGLGKGSLAMISQGTISQFAESKPEDRRAIFEEAAGVAKYKKRKLESLRKLERTQENLERLDDIVSELSRQIGPLKRQSEKATIYVAKKGELEGIEVALLVKDINIYNEQLQITAKAVKDLEINKVKYDTIINTKEASVLELRNKMTSLDDKLHKLQIDLLEVVDRTKVLENQRLEVLQKKNEVRDMQNVSSTKSRIDTLEGLVKDLQVELISRKQRQLILVEEINDLQNKSENLTDAIRQSRSDFEESFRNLNSLRSRKEVLSEITKNNSRYFKGVQSILNNKHAHNGVVGIVQELVTAEEKFAVALSTALGGRGQSIVVKTNNDAKAAVSFLKKNRAGRATFLPLDTIKEKFLREDMQLAASSVEGYIGTGYDVFNFAKNLNPAMSFLFGNVLIASTLTSATQISNLTSKRFKIITLDGDVINAGGSVTGGTAVSNSSKAKALNDLDLIASAISDSENTVGSLRIRISQQEAESIEVHNALNQREITKAKLDEVVDITDSKLMVSASELEELTGKKVVLEESLKGSAMLEELNEMVGRRDSIQQSLKEVRTLKAQVSNQWELADDEVTSARKQLRSIETEISDNKVNSVRAETQLENSLNRLNSEYKMTFDHASTLGGLTLPEDEAREIVGRLRSEIDALGNVNVDSIEQYAEVSTRYEDLSSQHDELIEARKSILDAIDEMDEKMTVQFASTFEEINEALQVTFSRLFGGGKASLEYSDPENILDSGIEVKVQPPGKAVANLNLFSGGEKSLIALSVLFAILKVRPVPLCILDEAEAPLDPANVQRFANYLHDFTDTTQFIVITHRDGTMEKCDILYGVTMQEKGVTKMVSVKLEDAVEMADHS